MLSKWKTVRVFISSTFRDMQAERDHIVRFVFPQMREELLKRHIHLVDVDLRWGVTSEQDALEVCKEIVDECRPRFLCILGGRYGWVPPGKARSITADEVHYGVLDHTLKGRGYAFFYFRDEETTDSMVEPTPGEFRESAGSRNQAQLSGLKQAIIDAGLNPFTYSAKWDNLNQQLTDLKIFGDHVYNDLMVSINEEFGTEVPTESHEFVEENSSMENFIEERVDQFILGDRDVVLDQIHHFLDTSGKGCLYLSGQPGSGKTALLGFFCRQFAEGQNTTRNILIPHFVGSYSGSTNLIHLLRRIINELESLLSGSRNPLPYDISQLKDIFLKLILEVPEDRKLILLIDGIDRLDGADETLDMTWLPRDLPSNVKLIIGGLDCPAIEAVRRKLGSLYEVVLGPLSDAHAGAIIDSYLGRYHKEMEADQRHILLTKPAAGNPLYLRSALEELRTIGTHDQFFDRIQSLPGTIQSLFTWIVRRLENDPGFRGSGGAPVGASLVKDYLSAIGVSRHGMSYSELKEIISPGDKEGNIAALTRLLRPYLSYRGELITFAHAEFQHTIEALYLGDDRENARIHAQIGAYFLKRADPSGANSSFPDQVKWNGTETRAFLELPFHVIKSFDYSLVAYLIKTHFLDRQAQVAGEEAAYSDSRTLLEALSESPECQWDDLRLGSQQYCDRADKIHNASNNIEELILTGDIHRIQAILNAVPKVIARDRLQYVISVLAEELGHLEVAHKLRIKPDPKCSMEREITKGDLALFLALVDPPQRAGHKPETLSSSCINITERSELTTTSFIQTPYFPVLDVFFTSGFFNVLLFCLSTFFMGGIFTFLIGPLRWFVWLLLAIPGFILTIYFRIIFLHWRYRYGRLKRLFEALFMTARNASGEEYDRIHKRILRFATRLYNLWWAWNALREVPDQCERATLHASNLLLADCGEPAEIVSQLLYTSGTIDTLADFLRNRDGGWVGNVVKLVPVDSIDESHLSEIFLRSLNATTKPKMLSNCLNHWLPRENNQTPEVLAGSIVILPRLILARAFIESLPQLSPDSPGIPQTVHRPPLSIRILRGYRRIWVEGYGILWNYIPGSKQPWSGTINMNPVEKIYKFLGKAAWALVCALATLWMGIALVTIGPAVGLMMLFFFLPLATIAMRHLEGIPLKSIHFGENENPRQFRVNLRTNLPPNTNDHSMLNKGAELGPIDYIRTTVITGEIMDSLRDRNYHAELDSFDPEIVVHTLHRLLSGISKPQRLFRVLADSRQVLSLFTGEFPIQPLECTSDLPSERNTHAELQRIHQTLRIQHYWSLVLGSILAILIWLSADNFYAQIWLVLPMAATILIVLSADLSRKKIAAVFSKIGVPVIIFYGIMGMLFALDVQFYKKPEEAIRFQWIILSVSAVITSITLINALSKDVLLKWQCGDLLFPTKSVLWKRRILWSAILLFVAVIVILGFKYNPLIFSLCMPGTWVWANALLQRKWPRLLI
ncbi:MAG: DUF4062 domain-containing protein [Bacteroidetes bacterium]|nr:DUF4062 domain-containing protein [Bacteroidota bacterium]